MVAPIEDVLVTVIVPAAAPVAIGLNTTSTVAVWPGLNVAGKELPESEYPVPLSTAELTVTELLPAEVSVTVCVADEFTITLPKATLVAFVVSNAPIAFS